MQLRLNNLVNTRKSYARIIRALMAGTVDIEKGRALGYLFSGMLGYWKLEADLQIEARLEQIEQQLEKQKDGRPD